MQQIQLSDTLYNAAARRASEDGYASVEAFVAALVTERLQAGEERFDRFFTPEIILELDSAVAEARASQSSTMEEFEARFAQKREAWLKNHAG